VGCERARYRNFGGRSMIRRAALRPSRSPNVGTAGWDLRRTRLAYFTVCFELAASYGIADGGPRDDWRSEIGAAAAYDSTASAQFAALRRRWRAGITDLESAGALTGDSG